MTLRLNGSTSGYTEIDAPAVAGSNTLVLPGGNGSAQQVLATNGSGVLSWSNRPILQVASTTKTDVFTSTTTGSWFDVTGLSVSITPTLSSNKILIIYSLVGNGALGSSRMQVRLMRDSLDIAVGDSAGSRLRATSATNYANDGSYVANSVFTHLDSPATTSSVTYKVQIRNADGSGTMYVNRTPTDTDASNFARYASSITVMEVAA